MLAILQLDAASVSRLGTLFEQGRLPTLAMLAERGRWLDLETPATHFAAGSFHTLYSGIEMADHGLFYPFQWTAPEQRVRYMADLEAPPAIWERLARLGRRTLAIDPYESRPPREAAGTFLSGWQFSDRVVLPRWSSPPGIHRRLGQLFGPPFHAEEVFGKPSVGSLLRLRRQLLAAPARVAEAAEHMLAEDRFDFAWFTFSAAHLAGHKFWDLSQLDADALDAGTRRVLQDALPQVYAAVDGAFARVLAALPEETDVIVTSPVGMEVNTSRADLLPEMLEAVLNGGAVPARAPGFIWRLRAAVPTELRGRVAHALPDRAALELTARLEMRGIDWARTRAFVQPGDNQGYIRINLKGREREGIVEPEAVDDLVDEIAEGLATFSDPDGTPAVAAVERVRDVFGEGERVDRLPDLIVRWSDRPATRLEGVTSARFGEVIRRGGASGRAGNHPDGGAWALVVPAAARHREPSRAPRVSDVAATVAGLVADDAHGMSGEPLLEPA